VGMVLEGLEHTLLDMKDRGFLTAADEALVALCLTAADSVEQDPGNPSLIREYRATLELLASRIPPPTGDEHTQFAASVSIPGLVAG